VDLQRPRSRGCYVRGVTQESAGERRTVRYGSAPEQFGEFRPGGDGAVAVLVHGGYWRKQYALDLMDPMAEDLVARGFAVDGVPFGSGNVVRRGA